MSATDHIAAEVARRLPGFAGRDFVALDPGFDSSACCAEGPDGRTWCFRFPRTAIAETRLRREAAVLAALRPHVAMAVPDLTLHDGRPPFTAHPFIPGIALTPEVWSGLPDAARDGLARDLARFAADLHAIPLDLMRAAGAGRPPAWLPVGAVRDLALPCLPPALRIRAEAVLSAFAALSPDPLGEVFSHFDGHGWNMAFDPDQERLNGVFDFGDSGIGPVHQDFIYSAFISPELTERMVLHYAAITGRTPDLNRIRILTGAYRLQELAEGKDDPVHGPDQIRNVEEWARWEQRYFFGFSR